MCSVQVPTLHEECKHYAQQTYTILTKIFNTIKILVCWWTLNWIRTHTQDYWPIPDHLQTCSYWIIIAWAMSLVYFISSSTFANMRHLFFTILFNAHKDFGFISLFTNDIEHWRDVHVFIKYLDFLFLSIFLMVVVFIFVSFKVCFTKESYISPCSRKKSITAWRVRDIGSGIRLTWSNAISLTVNLVKLLLTKHQFPLKLYPVPTSYLTVSEHHIKHGGQRGKCLLSTVTFNK